MEDSTALEAAVLEAFEEYDALGHRDFLGRFGDGPTRRVTIARGRRCDADALEIAIALRLLPKPATHGVIDLSWPNMSLLEATGHRVVALDAWTVADELEWRLNAWRELQRVGCVVEAGWLRERGLYNGGQGIWADKDRTQVLVPAGAAVSVRHTGRHYPDDLDDRMIIYYYPATDRPGVRDANEVEAVKNLLPLHLPIFVISDADGGRRREVRLAWVVAEDDGASAFLMDFAELEPEPLHLTDVENKPFALTGDRRRRRAEQERAVRDPEFKFSLVRRYRGACAITGLSVPAVLDGAHVVPVEKGGTDDERNGLLLTANLHRAFDANLWALDPRSLHVVTRRRGPSLAELQVTSHSLRPGVKAPHREALEWRYEAFLSGARAGVVDSAHAAMSS